MPIGNLKLLVRPDPGGLSDHRRFLAEEARSWLVSQGNLADFVISSEEGVKLPCHLSLLVPHSPLLRAILPTTGYASVYQLCLPVSTRTLRSMLEVLYTGEISATRTEVEEIKTGLTLLGILSPSDCPPPPPQQPRVKESDSSLAVGVINSSQAKDAASAVSLSVSESESKSRPTVELFGRTGEGEVSNQLRLHRTDQESPNNNINNNNTGNNNINTNTNRNENENLSKESRARRRRRVRSYCEDEESEVVKEEKTEEELLLEGVAVTKEVDCCQDCGASLPSEWHRPPNRHDCQAMSETVCQYCHVTVRGSWYLPPSRHHCPGSTNATTTKRRRLTNTSTTNTTRDYSDFSCPLVDCSRQCDSKKLLMLHLAIAHYQEELEDLYITGVCSDGGRVCPHCGDIQPGIKLNFIRHMAVEHEVVMELVERDVFQTSRDNDEDFNVNMA